MPDNMCNFELNLGSFSTSVPAKGSRKRQAAIDDALSEALRIGQGWSIAKRGAVGAAFDKSAGTRIFEARYGAAAALHARRTGSQPRTEER